MLTIAGDASRDIASNVSLSAVVAIVALLAVGAAGAWWFTRRRDTGHGAVAWFAAFGSTAGCLSLTLLREGLHFGFRPRGVLAWTTSGWDRLADENLLGSSQFLLNVALFVPPGVAWTWVTGRPWRSLGGLVGLTMAIESVQGLTGAGGADITDVAANALGASVGVGAAALATAALVRAGVVAGSPTSRRRRAFTAAGLAAVVALVSAGLIAGANHRQDRIHDELEDEFADITYTEVDAVVRADSDNPPTYGDGTRLVEFQQIMDAISVQPDGFRYSDEQIEIRWPALFFGFRRCVYVSWTPEGVEFSNASGHVCTDFNT